MKRMILLFILTYSLAYCKERKDQSTDEAIKQRDLTTTYVEFSDTTTRKPISNTGNCSNYLESKIFEIYNLGRITTEICEAKNGLLYINGKGFLNTKSGELFKLENSSHRLQIFEILKDSIICLRMGDEEIIFNLLTEYRYYKKRWSSGIFNGGEVDTYNGHIVPVFENDSTLLIVNIITNQIIKKIANSGVFYKKLLHDKNFIYVGSKSVHKIDLTNGEVISLLDIPNGLGSNMVLENNLLTFFEKDRRLVAYNLLKGEIEWQNLLGQKKTGFVKLLKEGDYIYYNDERVKAVNIATGKLKWIDNIEEYAIRKDNIAMAGNFIITGMSFDSDAVIVLIDKQNGNVVCNGYDMPEEMGFYRYIFFNINNEEGVFFARDGGDYGKENCEVKVEKAALKMFYKISFS